MAGRRARDLSGMQWSPIETGGACRALKRRTGVPPVSLFKKKKRRRQIQIRWGFHDRCLFANVRGDRRGCVSENEIKGARCRNRARHFTRNSRAAEILVRSRAWIF